MVFNVDKCKVIHVGRLNPMYEYFMKVMKLTTTEEEKDVGVHICDKKSEAQYAVPHSSHGGNSCVEPAEKKLPLWDRKTFSKLYKQYIRRHLEFASPACSPWNVGDQDELERVQQKAIKILTGLKGEKCEEKCQELGLETLKERRLQQGLMLAYKFIGGTIAGDKNLFKKTDQPESAKTRQAADPNNIKVQYSRTDTRKYSFGVQVVESWNRLDQGTKNCVEKRKFKARNKAKPRTQQMKGNRLEIEMRGSRLNIANKRVKVEGPETIHEDENEARPTTCYP
jgi:hypothetical protein